MTAGRQVSTNEPKYPSKSWWARKFCLSAPGTASRTATRYGAKQYNWRSGGQSPNAVDAGSRSAQPARISIGSTHHLSVPRLSGVVPAETPGSRARPLHPFSPPGALLLPFPGPHTASPGTFCLLPSFLLPSPFPERKHTNRHRPVRPRKKPRKTQFLVWAETCANPRCMET